MTAADTIFALSTAAGRAAIAVVRISGPASADAIRQLTGRVPPPRRAALAVLRDPQTAEPIDQALVLHFKAPASETGEDIAEFQIHGGRAVTHRLLETLGRIPGCRPAEAGEFAHRAFINGKLDLTAAEGLADLIDAETEAQRRQAMTQVGGHLADLYDSWRTRLIECLALTESAIDFSDEADVSDAALTEAGSRAKSLLGELHEHLAGADRGEIIRTGFRIVIAGPPNAGKSTLLNALARRDAAIVSEEAGTTRDAIEVHLNLAGLPVIITDTAGIRETSAKVEREGIRRTYDRAHAADLIIWLTDIGEPVPPPTDLASCDTRLLQVASKADTITGVPSQTKHAISAKTGAGLEELVQSIIVIANDRLGDKEQLVPATARQKYHLEQAQEHLSRYLDKSGPDIELRAEDLRLAAGAIGRLTGRIDAEDVLDQIFSRFCVGK